MAIGVSVSVWVAVGVGVGVNVAVGVGEEVAVGVGVDVVPACTSNDPTLCVRFVRDQNRGRADRGKVAE